MVKLSELLVLQILSGDPFTPFFLKGILGHLKQSATYAHTDFLFYAKMCLNSRSEKIARGDECMKSQRYTL